MSVGRIMAHISNAENYWFSHIKGVAVSGRIQDDEVGSIEFVKDRLNQVHQCSWQMLEGFIISDLGQTRHVGGTPYEIGWIIWHVIEHEIHHRGELSLILGLLGREGLDA